MDRLITLGAEDDEAIAGLIAAMLRDEGYNVETVSDGASAMSALWHRPPQLLILDYTMPIMTGGEVIAAIRLRGSHIPVILMSANTDIGLALSLEKVAFLAKPFDIDQLLHSVDEHFLPTTLG